MSEFDSKAREWDMNPMHWERSEAIAEELITMIPVNRAMKVLEYGAGTGILSFLLSDYFSKITLMDNSGEMVQVMHEKAARSGLKQLKPLLFDLENEDYHAETFDLIYNQMVMHHVSKLETLIRRFYSLLNPGGYLAIADLYSEDGSFHGEDFKGHNGFDVEELSKILEKHHFTDILHKHCYTVKRDNGNEYPVFLMIALK